MPRSSLSTLPTEERIIYPLAILALVIISAFFAAAETAVTGVSLATIHKLSSEGNKRAKTVTVLRNDKERLISALLLGNSACNTFASALGATFFISIFGQSESIILIATACMTVIIFVFAEVLPKTYAFENSERFALATAPLVYILVKILYPLTTAVQVIVNYILSLVSSSSKGSIMSGREALRGAIELYHHEGSVVKTDRDMLDSILDLDNTDVSEIMIYRGQLVTIDIDSSPAEIIKQAMKSHHTRIPLWKNEPDNIVGVLNIKDLLKVIYFKDGNMYLHKDIDIASIATTPWFIIETTSLREQLHEFKIRRNHFALVVDEYGSLRGAVTLEDILEEIVGQIEDEHDSVYNGITAQSDGSYLFDGTATIRDINRQLEWELPDEDVSTIAGLIMHETEIVPEEGESFILFGTKFTVMKKKYNQLSVVKAERLSHKEPEGT